MNVNKLLTMNYEKKDTWWTGKKRTQTNPNKPNFKIGKINISVATIKDYDNEQLTINNERYSKQTQNKPNFRKAKNELKLLFNKGL
jgi:hypothetical protein